MKGRPPKPAKLKVLQGNPSRRPIPDEIEITKQEIETPEYLTPPQKKKFNEIVSHFRKSQLLELVDADLVAEYAILCCEWLNIQKQIHKHGLIFTDANGVPYTTPLLDKSLKLLDSMRRYKEVLGMAPAYRAKLSRGMKNNKPWEKAGHPLARYNAQQ